MSQRVGEDLEVIEFEGLHSRFIVAALLEFIEVGVFFGAGQAMTTNIVEGVLRIATKAPEVWNHSAVDNLLFTVAWNFRHEKSQFFLSCKRFNSCYCRVRVARPTLALFFHFADFASVEPVSSDAVGLCVEPFVIICVPALLCPAFALTTFVSFCPSLFRSAQPP